MPALPREWVERIFQRLKEIYEHRWIQYCGDEYHTNRLMTLWSNALTGSSSEEIRHALNVCKNHPDSPIPNPIEFYYYGKKEVYPYKTKRTHVESSAVNKAIAHGALSKMKDGLSGRLPKENNVYV